MFAMLGGALRDADGVVALARAQAAAGLDVLTDGHESVPADPASAACLVDDILSGRGSGAPERWTAVAGATMGLAAAAALPGPWSLAARAAGATAGADGIVAPDPALVRSLGAALGHEARALGAAGCPLVRIDEPEAAALAAMAASAATGAAPPQPFFDGHAALVAAAAREAASDGDVVHLMLALTGGDHEALGAEPLASLGYHSYLFDLIAGPDDWRVIARLPGDRGVVCGVVDAASDAGDAPEILVWAAHYAASTGRRGLARVGLATTGSLAALTPDVAAAKMRALAEGARIAALPADAIAENLDPRALDVRSAAVGAWYRDPRFDRGGR